MKKLISVITVLVFVICNFSFAIADEYRLGPYDTLDISVLNHSELAAKATITPDGQISLPLLGFVEVQGKTLRGLDEFLTQQYSAYIKEPRLVINLTPKPIYIIQHDRKKNDWTVKSAKSVDEARAYMGNASPLSRGDVLSDPERSGELVEPRVEGESKDRGVEHGGVYKVDSGKQPDWWEDNWYKVLTATAVVVGVISTTRKW
jgi:hypothetical protein